MTEIKPMPCPFCGCELEYVGSPSFPGYKHPKNDCYLAIADSAGFPAEVLEDEIPLWNRRASNDL